MLNKKHLQTQINDLKTQITNLRYDYQKLIFRFENPPKYKVGDIIKNDIVTDVEIIVIIQYPCGDLFPVFSWAYNLTNIKTGKTSTI
jgi:hypothetical protein